MYSQLVSLFLIVQSAFGFYLLIESETEKTSNRLITASENNSKILIAGGDYHGTKLVGNPVKFELSEGVLSTSNGTQVGEYKRDNAYFDVVFQLNDEPVDKFSIDNGYLKYDDSDEFKACNGFTVNKYLNFLSVSDNCTVSTDLKLKVLEC